MKSVPPAKRWIASFLLLSILVLTCLAGLAYVIDPYFQYRAKDNTYFLTAQYVNPGLIKNHNYDTLIVGSCMIGNFDMNQFREELGLNPFKVERGGMNPASIASYLNYAAKYGKASQYFVNVDLATFQSDDEYIINEYLLKDDPLSKIKYLLGYETWFRFIPVDCGLMLYKSLKGGFPPGKFAQRTSFDQNGSWNLDERFGREIVVRNRKSNLYEVSEVDLDGLYERLITGIDSFISQLDFQSGIFTFIFPPYSALYWCDTQDLGYYDTFLAAKDYFIQELLNNCCNVYDFQSAEITRDLDNYKDSTHYCSRVNDWMTECFVENKYLVTAENRATLKDKLTENLSLFRKENPDLFS